MYLCRKALPTALAGFFWICDLVTDAFSIDRGPTNLLWTMLSRLLGCAAITTTVWALMYARQARLERSNARLAEVIRGIHAALEDGCPVIAAPEDELGQWRATRGGVPRGRLVKAGRSPGDGTG